MVSYLLIELNSILNCFKAYQKLLIHRDQFEYFDTDSDQPKLGTPIK